MSELDERLQRALGDAYRVERELGGGGMARVFVAEDVELERRIVVKVLPPDVAAELSVDRFKREILLAAKLQHPHLVPLLSAGAREGLLFYTMPLIDGESLRARLSRQHDLPISEVVRLLRDVVDALAYAHGQGVIHRDIKPDNVLVSRHHALVTDFGVSKALARSDDATLTSLGVALGTPAYMAPEQAAAEPNIDHRADIYSVGALAYELLTGRPPFVGAPSVVLKAQVMDSPTPVTQHRPTVPPALEHVVMRCLEKRPADRFQTAEELLTQLEVLATPSAGMTPTHSAPYRKEPLSRAARVAMATLALVVLAGVAGWWFSRPPAPYAIVATRQITNAPGLELDAAISPDGNLVAYSAGPRGRARVYVRQISGGTARLLTDSGSVRGSQRTPRWISGGQEITFVAGEKLYSAPALGGPAREVFDASGYEFASPALSPDAKSVAFAKDDGVYVAELGAGDAPRRLATARYANFLVWSPDGRWLAYVVDNPWYVYSTGMLGNIAASSIWVVSVSGGEPVRVTEIGNFNASPAWMPDSRGLLYVSGRGGGRDVYQQALSGSGKPRGGPARLTTGLNAHTITLSADGRRLAYTVLSSRSNIWTAPIGAGTSTFASAHPITDENQTVEGLAVSPDGRWLAYDSNRGGRQHIYKIPVAGGDATQLTRDSTDDFSPSWSPDGREIAFHGWRNGNRDIFVVDADGRNVRAVTLERTHEMYPGWSPDGRRLAFLSDRGGTWDIFVTRRLAAGAWAVPQRLTTGGGYTGRWSPDGHTMAYTFLPDSSIWLLDSNTGKSHALFDARARGVIALNPEFGSRPDVVYVHVIERDGRHAIYEIPIRGGAPRSVLRFDDPARQPRRTEFATDGRRLFFTITTDESDIWVMDLQGG